MDLGQIKKKAILLVEPDESLRDEIKGQIEEKFPGKTKVVLAVNGVDGASRLPFQKFDCVITETDMPKRGGHAFIQSVRECEHNAKSPVILLRDSHDPIFLGDDPFVEVVNKPFDMDDFLKVVQQHTKISGPDLNVTVSLLNCFIMCFDEFLERVLGVKGSLEKPKGKVVGDHFAGDYHYVADLLVDGLPSRYVIGVEEMVLQALYQGVKDNQEMNYGIICQATGQTLVKYGLKKHDGVGEIADQFLLGDSGRETMEELKVIPAINVTVQTEFGYIYLYALAI